MLIPKATSYFAVLQHCRSISRWAREVTDIDGYIQVEKNEQSQKQVPVAITADPKSFNFGQTLPTGNMRSPLLETT
jgi:hypothetical protein